ncbi:MAG TPA: hypothetical protein VG917_05655 [Patescibacteria group bacterium]|nr:hypothetical protein [Patescibacteria group bacterium]
MISFYKNSQSNKLVITTVFISLFYFLCLAINLSPYFRGPIDSSLASQWPYYFVNTISKAWIFIPIFIGYLAIFNYIYKSNNIERKEWYLLFLLGLLTFVFQIALVYFSRFGIGVLFRRLVDPGINGYFTTAIKINDIGSFLNSYPEIINARHLAQHSSGHTPGAVLLIKAYIGLLSILPTNALHYINNLQVGWAKNLWTQLTFNQRLAAISLPFLLHLVSAFTIVPFYFLAKKIIKDSKNSLKITIIYSITPSLSFFALIFDPFYAILAIVLVLLIYIGIDSKNNMYLFWAGCFTAFSLFFTAAILTVLIGAIVFGVISYFIENNKNVLGICLYYIVGVLISFLGLKLIGFDLIQSIIAVVHNQASRDYLPWLIFNPYDFFVYMGFPISLIFIYKTIYYLKQKFDLKDLNKRFLYVFWLVFIALIVSGSSRGEVGRIWLPFMFLPVILVGNFITNELRFNKLQFIILFSLIFIQVIIMEEFWVPIW